MKPADIAKIEWHFWHKRHRTPLYLFFIWNYPTKKYVDLGVDYTVKTHGAIVDSMVSSEKELREMGNRVWKKEQAQPGFLLKFMQGIEKQNKQQIAKWIKWKNETYAGKTNSQLLQRYKEYLHDLEAYSPTIFVPLALEDQLFAAGLKTLEKIGKVEAEKILFQPVKPGIAIEEEESLLEIAIALKRGEKIEKKLQKHVELFSWMKKNNYFMEFYDEKYYLERANAIKSPEQKLGELREKIAKQEKAFEELLFHSSEADRITLQTVNHAIFFRSYRTEKICQSSYYIIELFREIAKRAGLASELDTAYLLPSEVENALLKKADYRAIIADRKIAYTYITSPTGDIIAGGDAALECLRYFEKTQKSKAGKEARGMVTCKGYAKGRAVIVRNAGQLNKVKQGNIMIAHSTMPDYVPALKLVKGLVTEEGGILCHAALVSREMQIPCIVGAKHATEIFKDGDEVEIDTATGVVRKVV